MNAPRPGPGTHGMTLLEVMIALTVFSAILASAVAVLNRQSRAFRLGNERMAALQNVRFALRVLEADLRTLGTGVPDIQPALIYAGDDAVAFNANYVTNLADDPFAVFYDPDAPPGSVAALTRAQRAALPGTGFAYPDTSYGDPVNSPAETITFFFTPDSSTSRQDDYALFRQVNRERPELVARHLLRATGAPFLRYHRLLSPASGAAAIVPAAAPLAHTEPIHLALSDTGSAAVIDSVRAVEINIVGTNGLVGRAERRRQLRRVVRLPNAGLAVRRICGDEPLLGTTLTAAVITGPSGQPAVQLSWGAATDETGGEGDVVRYVLWRRLQGAADWGEPFLSIPAGNAMYVYEDGTVNRGDTYVYGLAAQDCTPALSSLAQSGATMIP